MNVPSDRSLKVQIKRVDPTLPLPQHETSGAVGVDLICREGVTVASGLPSGPEWRGLPNRVRYPI